MRKFTFEEIRQAAAAESMSAACGAVMNRLPARPGRCTEAEWLEAGCREGRGSAALSILNRARKIRDAIPVAADDDVVYVHEIKEEWRKLHPKIAAAGLDATIDELVHNIFSRRENFPDGCIVVDAKNCWWQRHDMERRGWYAFGSNELYADDVPVRPLDVQS